MTHKSSPGISVAGCTILADSFNARFALIRFAPLLLAVLVWAIPVTSSDTRPWGEKVVSIRLESDAAGMGIGDFSKEIVQKEGEPLDQSKVAESIKNLYATGRFQEIRVDYKRKEPGIELIFVTKAQFFVGVVRVLGSPKGVGPNALTSAARLRLGQPLRDEDLAQARARLGAILAESGYLQARVTSEVETRDYQEADVVFSVVAGPQARLSGIDFQGQLLVPPRRLASIAGWKPRSHLTSGGIDRGLTRIHRYYVKHGRVEATAILQSRTPDPSKHTEKLIVEVHAGPLVNVSVHGARIGSSKLRQLLPLFTEGQTDELVLSDGQRQLHDYLERQGYYSALVHWNRTASPDGQRVDIVYQVNRGPRGRFEGYDFKGIKNVPADDLEDLITLKEPTFLKRHGVFSHGLMTANVKQISSLYRSRGYLDARVSTNVNDHYEGKSGLLFVIFNIDEGPKTTVGRLTVQGVDQPTESKIKSLLATKPGAPYSPDSARNDEGVILTYLADQGNTHTSVNWTVSPPSPQHQVDLDFRIEPGPREQIRRIVVMGEQHTRAGVIRHRLTMAVNQPLRQSDMLESQRRLYDLGVFNQVQIAHQDPDMGGTDRTVLVSVEEAKRWTLGYGFGIDVQRLVNSQPQGQYSASPRLSLEVTRTDVGGRPQTFSLRGRYSDLEKGGQASYLIPHLLNREKLDLRLTALDEETSDVLTFTAKRQEADVSLERRTSASTFVLFRYSFRKVAVIGSTLRIAPEEIPLFSQPARIAMTSLTYVNDHRDNPVDATKGSYSLADVGVAWQGLGSEANFTRVSGQNSTYYRLGPHLIFARNTRLGVESIFGGLRKVVIPASDGKPSQVVLTHDIPLPERFFMGGSDSDRGFALNQAGPRDPATGFPIGGRALFLNSLELRIPVDNNKYGIVLFHDAGNVFSAFRTMRLLKVTQNSPTDLDYTVHAVGVGVRYNTPVGPLRLDVGYSLNPPRFQVTNSTTGALEVHRLSNVQFSLSVGQAF